MSEIHESAENYLETILILQNKNGSVRSVDIANEMSYTKPSISRAMGRLKESAHITVEENGNIIMTESGRKLAECIYERHRLLTDCLTAIGVSPDIAAEDACRIEHDISLETFDKIKKFYETLKS